MKVLVTGGAGYIGSHTVVTLLAAGHEVVIIDNLSNSKAEAINRIERIAGIRPAFYQVDLCDQPAVEIVFAGHTIDAVIHFAGFKAVGESVEAPLRYYHNNLISTINLLEVMQQHAVYKLIFSSSCTVYGNPARVPIAENSPIHAFSPYGQTKAMIEQILQDLAITGAPWQISLLRYFNPVGAHPSGLIGEDPLGIPGSLLPYAARVLAGKLPRLHVFGNDYDTPDGTCIRDFIHVMDLAAGHTSALKHLPPTGHCSAYNLGTGRGNSVLEVIAALETAAGKPLSYDFVARRPGDIMSAYADPTKAARELKWRAKLTLAQACADQWNWQSRNPDGYA